MGINKRKVNKFLNDLYVILLALALLLIQCNVNSLKKDITENRKEIAELKIQIEDLLNSDNKSE